MPIAQFLFSETSPSAPGTKVSGNPVAGSASWAPAGVAAPLDDFTSVGVVADLVGATNGALDIYLQQSPDQGLNWYDVVHWRVAAGAAAVSYSSPISQSTSTTVAVVVGKGTSPALASGAVVNGAFSDRMRLVMVAGSGTTAGAPVTVRLTPQRKRIRELGG
jgi:hypothetical protein